MSKTTASSYEQDFERALGLMRKFVNFDEADGNMRNWATDALANEWREGLTIEQGVGSALMRLKTGKPKRNPIRGTSTQKPAPDARSLSKAKRLYKGFTGRSPRTLKQLAIPALPATGLAIGRVFGIMYDVAATGERFQHEFKGKSRPLLVVSDDGKQVFLIGGSFTFTQRGFVDRK